MPEEPGPPPGAKPEEPPAEEPVGLASLRTRQRRSGMRQLFAALEQQAPEQAKLLSNAVGMKLVLIPTGKFQMGSAEAEAGDRLNETPQHEVTLTRGFYMAIHLVTQEQYAQVMGANPARFHQGTGGSPQHPVERVSWEDAIEFCRKLSELPEEKQAGRVYRLPTEAEWEYACRAGTTTPFSAGPALGAMHANFDCNFPHGAASKARSAGKTTRVGSFPANNFGLFDLHGNLWEWCADWYDGSSYRQSDWRDPVGPQTGRFKVVRGGCWRNHAARCRSAYRNALVPHNRDPYTGFRVVVSASEG